MLRKRIGQEARIGPKPECQMEKVKTKKYQMEKVKTKICYGKELTRRPELAWRPELARRPEYQMEKVKTKICYENELAERFILHLVQ